MHPENKTSHLFILAFTLIIGFVTLLNESKHKDVFTDISPNSQVAQLSLISQRVQPNPSENVLVVYNTEVPDSAVIKDYYINNRPGFSGANVLGVSTVTTLETIPTSTFNSTILAKITEWIQTNPTKHIKYIVMMYGMPSRVDDSATVIRGSVDNEVFKSTSAYVTRIDMGSVEATKAYINKLVAMCNCQSNPKIVISPEAGKGGDTYIFDESQAVHDAYPAHSSMVALLTENPSAKAFYSTNYGTSTSNHILTGNNIKGYMTWGANGWLGTEYAQVYVKFSGNSNWYIIQTIESFNGTRVNKEQGNFVDWFAKDAFGSTNYEHTPVGAVVHVFEPSLFGVNTSDYFRLWEHGYMFSEVAWASHVTPYHMALGDPFVSVGNSSNSVAPISGNPVETIMSFSGTDGKGKYFGAGLFPARDVSLPSGQSITLNWKTTNTTSCKGTGGSFTGDKPLSGSEVVTPAPGVFYRLTCNALNNTLLDEQIHIRLSEPLTTIYKVSTSTDGTGKGMITCDPNTCSALVESTVTLTATPLEQSFFSAWTGCIPLPTDPRKCRVTLDSDKTVNARFITISGNQTGGSINGSTDLIPPSVPTNAAVVLDGKDVRFSWGASVDNQGGSGVAGYRLYKNNIARESTTALFVFERDVAPGTIVCWAVESYDNAGNVSDRTTNSCLTVPESSVENTAVNTDPVLSTIGPKTIAEGSLLSFSVSASDANAGDTLSFAVTELPATATFNRLTRTFSFSPSFTQSGTYSPTFRVADGRGGYDSETVVITVTNTNRQPEVEAGLNRSVPLSGRATLAASSSDPDGQTLTFSWSKMAGPGTVVFSTAVASTTYATFSAGGVYTIKVTVSDGALTSSDTVMISVDAPLPQDADNDSVLDSADKCPQTPSSASSFVNTVGCPKPKTDKFIVTPDMDVTDLNAVSGFKLRNTYGSIDFTGSTLKLIRNDNRLDIDRYSNIIQSGVWISPQDLPELNKPARITLNNVTLSNPQIMRDGSICSACVKISYSGGNLVFDAPNASVYSVIEKPVPVVNQPSQPSQPTQPTYTPNTPSYTPTYNNVPEQSVPAAAPVYYQTGSETYQTSSNVQNQSSTQTENLFDLEHINTDGLFDTEERTEKPTLVETIVTKIGEIIDSVVNLF